ncbi:UBP-type zinc finger domain-containing protein [Streptomyces sp. NPDC005122]
METWTVAADGGRPEGRSCSHLAQVVPGIGSSPGTRGGPDTATGCAECATLGQRWVHLRRCLTCGHLGCCDSSRGRHAAAHYERTGHPIARSAEKGETWAWLLQRRGLPGAPVGRREARGTLATRPGTATGDDLPGPPPRWTTTHLAHHHGPAARAPRSTARTATRAMLGNADHDGERGRKAA